MHDYTRRQCSSYIFTYILGQRLQNTCNEWILKIRSSFIIEAHENKDVQYGECWSKNQDWDKV